MGQVMTCDDWSFVVPWTGGLNRNFRNSLYYGHESLTKTHELTLLLMGASRDHDSDLGQPY